MNEKNLIDLKNFFRGKGITQNEIANILGISRVSVSNLLNGKDSFGKRRAVAWAEAFGLNPLWLMTGAGEMTLDARANNNNVTTNGNNNKTQIGGFSVSCCPTDDEISAQLDELCGERVKQLEDEVKQLRAERATLITIINNLSKTK